MGVKLPSNNELLALVGTELPGDRTVVPVAGTPNWYYLHLQRMWLMSRSAAGTMRVERSDVADTSIEVFAGRARFAGVALPYAGGTIDLSAYDDDTAYVWAYNNAGTLTIGKGTDAAGWPTYAHIKLAEVTLASGSIGYDAIVDRRPESLLRCGDGMSYLLAIQTQGDTGSASRIHIQAKNEQGDALAGAAYLRVRVCDSAGYANATNATIAAAGSTTLVETLSANKDLVFKSSAAGLFEIDMTDATAETVTIRIGAAPIGAGRGDYSPSLDVTHAAP